MNAMVHCYGCQRSLTIPPNAAGYRVKCPACGAQFRVPEGTDLLEETISSWIEQEVDEELTTRDRIIEEQLAATIQRPRKEEAKPEPRPRPRSRSERAAEEKKRNPLLRREREGAPPADSEAVLRKRGDAPADTPPVEAVRESAEASSEGPRIDTTAPDGAEAGYPQALTVTEPIPHLVVLGCDSAGVHFAFDSVWLNHAGFRRSFPVRCVFSGHRDRSQLIARPLVFLDQARNRQATIENLSGGHEQRMLGDRSPAEIGRAMGQIGGMPRPFNEAVPYYVSNSCAHLYLHCQTRQRSEDGGTTCEVLVPDLNAALEWLERVNGVCGKEYELLAGEAAMLHGEAWKALSELTRKRITGWCKLEPREVFYLYLNDADFGKRDEGLAGLVVTDQRLGFCKYHHRGQVSLNEKNAMILARSEGRFAHLTLLVGADRSRMIKLHDEDLKKLKKTLKDAGSEVRIVATEED